MLLAIPFGVSAQDAGIHTQPGDSSASLVYPIDPETALRPSVRALRTTSPIVLDGILDEESWQQADSSGDFIINLPRVGYPASENTVIRVLYDERNLYIGAHAYDSEPDRLTISGLQQDFQTHDSDVFAVAIDTYHDYQNAFLFATNPAGATFDAQVFNDSRQTNRAWEGVIHIKTQMHDEGWTAEIAIPFTTLRFARTDGEQIWGINFMRRVRRQNEDGYWAPIDRQYRVHKMSRAGTLTGLTDLRQGRNLTLKPYASAGRKVGALRVDDSGNEFDAGFDLKYGVTPRLTLDVTAFTDFSQVEVDQEQVNLTRFPLFFPEKRDFFMENEGIFTLGDLTERNYRMGSSLHQFTLFHSRRIGLSEDRQPVPILGGARLTGRLGGFEVGLLNVQTQSSNDISPENFAVARLRRNVLGNSDVGFMFINRQPNGGDTTGYYNRSFGLDGNFRLLRYMIINSYFTATDEPDVTGNRNAARVQVAWRDPVWDASVFAKHVGDAFNPEVGFVLRRNVRQLFATVGAHPQPGIPQVIEFNPYVDVDLISSLDWTLESRAINGGLGTTFIDGGILTLQHSNRWERLLEADDVLGIEIPAGEYRFGDASLDYRSSGARVISGNVRLSHGGFFNGEKTSVALGALLRPSFHLSIDGTAQHNAVMLSDSSFTADVFGGRIRYAYSTKLFLSAFVQYNTSSDELVTNVRFNFIHAPLSDLFLVYTERRDVANGILLDRVLTAKVTRLFAF